MTTVLIVDDLGSIREFLKINLSSEPDIKIIGLADNGQSAIAQVGEHQPDIVLMDIEMPGNIDGIAATKVISNRFPKSKVLLLTSQDDRQQLNLGLQAGARGYILKNSSVKDIATIIRLTEKGFFQIGPILDNWNGSQHHSLQSDTYILKPQKIPSKVGVVVENNGANSAESADTSSMNHVLSNLTSGLFQLQETIRSQEDTIINLTNQYSQVQQEIKVKLKRDKHITSSGRVNSYRNGLMPRFASQRRQHLLFIASFLLGIFTVLIMMFLIMTLGSA
ncbi:response regulator [Pleurocapsa sp. FMAR1]|uniref:response regulator n=1 Tax=Pleurocapsa sp. FMAR1 TaxID=3040204 RepID=UPI0029C64541|nr:response regulator transcription factor [Pleurocapsa sp. FMAR1]